MHRVDTAGNLSNLFTDGNPGIGQQATVVDAAILNAVQEELCNTVTGAGISLVKGTWTQLASAITARIASAIASFVAGAVTWAGAHTFNGAETHNGTETHHGAVTFTSTVTIPNPSITYPAPVAGTDSGLRKLALYQDAQGMVHIEGEAEAGTGTIWNSGTIPSGMRPGAIVNVACSRTGGLCTATVQPGGGLIVDTTGVAVYFQIVYYPGVALAP